MIEIIYKWVGRMKLKILLLKLLEEVMSIPTCPSLQTYIAVSHSLKRGEILSTSH